jgi:hypothetical protein
MVRSVYLVVITGLFALTSTGALSICLADPPQLICVSRTGLARALDLGRPEHMIEKIYGGMRTAVGDYVIEMLLDSNFMGNYIKLTNRGW